VTFGAKIVGVRAPLGDLAEFEHPSCAR
jgi:hypothetical protein